MACTGRLSPWRVVVVKDSAGAAMYPIRKQAETAAHVFVVTGIEDIKGGRASGTRWSSSANWSTRTRPPERRSGIFQVLRRGLALRQPEVRTQKSPKLVDDSSESAESCRGPPIPTSFG